MKKILIIGTGGTIAGKGDTGKTHGYKPGELKIQEIIQEIPQIHQLAEISGLQLFNCASDNLTSHDLIHLATTINTQAESDEVDGIVVTHGTDTLEETAYFLHLTVKTNKPVILTGAMRPATATSADGPHNLYQAVALASHAYGVGKGVLVVFSDAIYSAREVTKVNTFRTEGFHGRDFGCIGYMRDHHPEIICVPAKLHTLDTPFQLTQNTDLPKVGIAYFHLDADSAILRTTLACSKGIVIAGAGNGGFSGLWREVILAEEFAHYPIVVSSRIANGLVTKHPTLPEHCIGAGTLNPQKARILLQLALTITSEPSEIQEIFRQY